MVFEREDEALKVQETLSKRFSRFGLTLHPEKTRLIRFTPRSDPGRSRARKWLRLPRVHVLREAEPCRRLVSPDEDLQQVDDPRSPEHGLVAPPESTPSDPGAAQGLGDPSPWALRLLRDPVQPGSMLDAPMACRTTLEEVAESPLPAPLDDLVRVQQAAETVPTSSTSSTPTGAAESVDCEPRLGAGCGSPARPDLMGASPATGWSTRPWARVSPGSGTSTYGAPGKAWEEGR